MHIFANPKTHRRQDQPWRKAGAVLIATLLLASCASSAPEESGFPANEDALTDTLRQTAENAERGLQFEAAAGHYGRLAERVPDSIEPPLGQARNQRYAGAPREAISTLRRAIETHGEEPPLLLELAKAQFASALTADAGDTLARLRAETPDDWQVYAMLGMLRDNKGDFTEAQELYRQALSLSPDNPTVINNYSLSLAQAGELTQAIQLLEPIAFGEQSTVQTRQNLAMLYVLNGDSESAEKLVEGDLPPDLAAQNLSTFQSLAE